MIEKDKAFLNELVSSYGSKVHDLGNEEMEDLVFEDRDIVPIVRMILKRYGNETINKDLSKTGICHAS